VLKGSFVTDGEHETDQDVSVMDVHREFDELRRKHGVEGGFGMKKVTRKYAFEQAEVPRGEADWYKVVYGFDRKELPYNLSEHYQLTRRASRTPIARKSQRGDLQQSLWYKH